MNKYMLGIVYAVIHHQTEGVWYIYVPSKTKLKRMETVFNYKSCFSSGDLSVQINNHFTDIFVQCPY